MVSSGLIRFTRSGPNSEYLVLFCNLFYFPIFCLSFDTSILNAVFILFLIFMRIKSVTKSKKITMKFLLLHTYIFLVFKRMYCAKNNDVIFENEIQKAFNKCKKF